MIKMNTTIEITPEDLYSKNEEIQNYIQESWLFDLTSKALRDKDFFYCPVCHTVTQWKFWHSGYPDCIGESTDGVCQVCGYHEGYC